MWNQVVNELSYPCDISSVYLIFRCLYECTFSCRVVADKADMGLKWCMSGSSCVILYIIHKVIDVCIALPPCGETVLLLYRVCQRRPLVYFLYSRLTGGRTL